MSSNPIDKPPLNEETLMHYGVKGMHWGKVKKEEKSGRTASKAKPAPSVPKNVSDRDDTDDAYAMAQAYLAASKKGAKPSDKEALANLTANQKKFHDKFEPSVAKGEDPHKGLTPEQKAALKKAAIGAAVVGGIAAAVYLSQKSGGTTAGKTSTHTSWAEEYAAKQAKKVAKFEGLAGQAIHKNDYAEAVSHSKSVAWSAGYIKDSSFKQTGFTLPAGHTFHRISTGVETSFKNGGTYATHSTEDFHRYVAAFRQEKGGQPLNHINFTTKGEFRVPSLVDTLQTMKETLAEMNGVHVDDVPQAKVVSTYQRLSGGAWSNEDKGTATFFANLAKKGYHAIVDEMDAGVIGEAPLVIFGHDNLTEKTHKPLTSEAIKLAESSLIEIANRKLTA